MRKTIDVRPLIERANFFLRETDDSQFMERKGVASFLETALFDAGAYKGFRYLDSAGLQREEGELVEIADDTRRAYYIHPNL